MSGIFISYRRGAHTGLVLAVRERLARHFGPDQVFLDTESIPAGRRYPDELRERLAGADVLLAVVHPGWAEDPRLREDGDWVRLELETALAAGTPVVPVLLDGAPRLADRPLPDPLRDLALRQEREVRSPTWSGDVDRLIPDLEAHAAPTWTPWAGVPDGAVRRRGRRTGLTVAALAAVLLVLPAALAAGSGATADGVPWTFTAGAVLLGIQSLVLLVTVLVGPLLDRALGRHERLLHAAPPAVVDLRVSLPLGLLIAVVPLVFGLLDRSAPGVVIGLLGLVAAVTVLGIWSVREAERDTQLRENWPYRLPVPPTEPALRRAVALTRARVGALPTPPTRADRDKAGWMLATLDAGARTLRAAPTRREALAGNAEQAAIGVLAAALTAGLLATAPVYADIARPDVLLALLTAAVAVPATTAELKYRRRVRLRRAVAAEVAADVAELRGQLERRVAPARRPGGAVVAAPGSPVSGVPSARPRRATRGGPPRPPRPR